MIIKKRKVIPVPQYQPANYDTALDFLIGLSSEDYTKLCRVVEIYRQANYDSAKVLEEELLPTTFINEKKPKLSEVSVSFLDAINNDKRSKK